MWQLWLTFDLLLHTGGIFGLVWLQNNLHICNYTWRRFLTITVLLKGKSDLGIILHFVSLWGGVRVNRHTSQQDTQEWLVKPTWPLPGLMTRRSMIQIPHMDTGMTGTIRGQPCTDKVNAIDWNRWNTSANQSLDWPPLHIPQRCTVHQRVCMATGSNVEWPSVQHGKTEVEGIYQISYHSQKANCNFFTLQWYSSTLAGVIRVFMWNSPLKIAKS